MGRDGRRRHSLIVLGPLELPPHIKRPTRWLVGLLAVAMGLIVLVLIFGGEGVQSVRPAINRGSDFLAFWTGGAMLDLGRDSDLYVRKATAALQHRFARARFEYWAVYPPPLYNVMDWLQPLGFLTAVRLWLLAIPLAAFAACAVLTKALPELGEARGTALALGALAPFSIMAVLTGQPGAIWVLPLAAGVLALRHGRPLLAGFVLGWLCAKPSLGATVAVWLVLTRQWRAFGGFVVGGSSLVLVSAAVGGAESWFGWVEYMVSGEMNSFRPAKSRQITLRALFTRPFLKTPLDAPLGVLAMTFAAATAAWAGRAASRFRPRDADWVPAAGLSLSATMLALPYILGYDGGFHLLAFAGTLLLLPQARRPRLGAVLLALAWLAPFMHPASKLAKFSFGSLAMAAWGIWMVLELRYRAQALSDLAQLGPSRLATRPPA